MGYWTRANPEVSAYWRRVASIRIIVKRKHDRPAPEIVAHDLAASIRRRCKPVCMMSCERCHRPTKRRDSLRRVRSQ